MFFMDKKLGAKDERGVKTVAASRSDNAASLTHCEVELDFSDEVELPNAGEPLGCRCSRGSVANFRC